MIEDAEVVCYVSVEGNLRDYRPFALADFEAFVRTVAAFDGPEHEAVGWDNFVSYVTSGSYSNYFANALDRAGSAVISVDRKDSQGAYGRCQRLCRRLGIGRMPGSFWPMNINHMLALFDDWLDQHGYACFDVPSDGDGHTAVVAKEPAVLAELASGIGFELERCGPATATEPMLEPIVPVSRAVARDAWARSAESIEFLSAAVGDRLIPQPYSFQDPAQRLCRDKAEFARLCYSAGEDSAAVTTAVGEALELSLRCFSDPHDRLRPLERGVLAMARLLALDDVLSEVTTGVETVNESLMSALIWPDRRPLASGHSHFDPFVEPVTIVLEDPANAADSLLNAYELWFDLLPERIVDFREPETSYLGSWAFEIAALVAMTGIDDSALLDRPLYPADLVGGRSGRSSHT
ncbi:MAG: PoNe immunity protein domain-containing protein [Actinomycetota bacterium]